MGRLPTSERPRSLSLGTGAVRFSLAALALNRRGVTASLAVFVGMVDRTFLLAMRSPPPSAADYFRASTPAGARQTKGQSGAIERQLARYCA